MPYHDLNYQLQDALEAVLETALDTYASGIAASLPFVKAGDFGDRGRDHIYIACTDAEEMPDTAGSMTIDVIVGVATNRNTSMTNHRAYWKAVCDLCRDSDLEAALNAAGYAIRVNQVNPPFRTSIGAVNDGVRFAQIQFSCLCYST